MGFSPPGPCNPGVAPSCRELDPAHTFPRPQPHEVMTAVPPPAARSPTRGAVHPLIRGATVVALLGIFLLGVNGLGDGFKSLGHGVLDSFFAATENPFVSLMVGILATTLVQSSSVTTSLVVALVAAPENPLPVANAVPMIMGANIGTTVTNTIVALGHMGRREEFRRAFAVATCHDFFNFLTVIVLLPLEIATGYLRRTASVLTSFLTGLGGVEYDSPIKGALKAGLTPVKGAIAVVASTDHLRAILLIALSGVLIFASLLLLVRVMRSAMLGRIEVLVSRVFDRAPLVGMVVGMLVTVAVQSSSITTSLLVPLAGAGVITLHQAFPITIGANIGTTVTALLAALAATGVNASAGITIAVVHLLFNVSGTLLVYPARRIRKVPLIAAQWLANAAVRSRRWALLYVITLFYGLPAVFALFNRILE